MTSSIPPKVHPVSQAGFGATKAELYDAVRPYYPKEVVTHIRTALSVKDKLRIVEIASGTGKFTKSLVANLEWKKCLAELKCVEPNEGMRVVFTRTMDDPRVSLANGTFDNTGVPDNWADLVVVATAIHWCLDFEAAMNEFVRILKPDGVVCLVWNIEDPSRAAWLKQCYDACLPKRENSPSSGKNMERWREIFDLPVYKQNFGSPEETTIRYSEPRTLDSIVALFMTWSGIAVLPEAEKEEVKDQIRAMIKRGDGLVWIDKEQGIFEMPFVSQSVIFKRASSPGDSRTSTTARL
ncbi:S-adenosyl-L-methionine-dependent methyltransferase [Fomitiporia mediterranea MF3/22]|uniref:S-adenosyl-L-methionine-dependent methyltransferase n=1 Tax=Fomitiporia mediterranea (strain MF3/22) TaxID=694068 RepID=UPI0004408F07|nr:S-adenosyl-L-methionine-dependent methyltransferase [Fomitiporia mediterranea MF3/22]EJD02317.1 S-adenosyl-L-methionine-dependent methyltransferase [Fomitiporia mediterranea MF3/22]